MQHSRLKWITKAIEYDRLKNSESAFLFNFVERFMEGKLTTKTDEEYLEKLFTEVQWREIEKETIYAIWSKKEGNKELMLPPSTGREVTSEASP